MSLQHFSLPVREWFSREFGEPTLPQTKTWPAIQEGDSTLTLAPTGSGKTLAAFLWGIDQLYRELGNKRDAMPGVRLLYVSPLKALNNDIERNLKVPLAGIRRRARELKLDLPELRVAVRSGDTPQSERSRMVTNPPQILITTPESLYILLTSPKARTILKTVRTAIIDEIHVLAGNKRGAHLALALERLQHLATQPIQRIGLSATVQPLKEVAAFLGGSDWCNGKLRPRKVKLIDAHFEKDMDLEVVSVASDFYNLPGNSIYPTLVPEMLKFIRQHKTTLCFVNNRSQAERMAERLNQQYLAEERGEGNPMLDEETPKGLGLMGAAAHERGPFHAHHGSLSKEARFELEHALKAGDLPALVGTASLELGIDIGSIDLMLQLDSPKSVAQGLQRIGRSGHLVGQTSKGRFVPTNSEALMEAAAVAGGMLKGEVEDIHMVSNPLDVLAQQIVAMVAVDDWDEDALFKLIRQSKPYAGLTKRALQCVLAMLGGKFRSETHKQFRPRIVWDRSNKRITPLRRSRVDAVMNAGTITDQGLFRVYQESDRTLIGELDEEFVHETRRGDVFVLGSQVWRTTEITEDKVLVKPAPDALPRMPFWRGDLPWRPSDLGWKVGLFRRETSEMLQQLKAALKLRSYRDFKKHADSSRLNRIVSVLRKKYALDRNSAWLILDYVARQLDELGAISSDKTVVFELFFDVLGDPRLVIHSPFGGRINGAWGTAIADVLAEKSGVNIEWQSNDDAIMLRSPDLDSMFPIDAVSGMRPEEAREHILRELPNSAVFGSRFRQNAARSLLLPGSRPGQRMPYWLQRLRAKDLLQIVSRWDDFPVLVETYRDCLNDLMDVPQLEVVLRKIQSGEIKCHVVETEVASSTAQRLLWAFRDTYIYEWDTPRGERHMQALAVDLDLLQDVLGDTNLSDIIRPEAVNESRSHSSGQTIRDADELFLWLQQVGDLTPDEAMDRCGADWANWMHKLESDDRAIQVTLKASSEMKQRWLFAEYINEYRYAGLQNGASAGRMKAKVRDENREAVLRRFLRHSGPVRVDSILYRYAFPEAWLTSTLKRLTESGDLYAGRITSADEDEYVDLDAMRVIHRKSLALARREVEPVSLDVFQDFLLRLQHVHPDTRLSGAKTLEKILEKQQGNPVQATIWPEVLRSRSDDFHVDELTTLLSQGQWVWITSNRGSQSSVRFVPRGRGSIFLNDAELADLSADAETVLSFLRSEGALYFNEIASGTGLEATVTRTALHALATLGLVTNESFSVLQTLARPDSESLEPPDSQRTQQDERLDSIATTRGRKRRTSDYRAARNRARRNSRSQTPTDGRWDVVHRFGILGQNPSPTERIHAQIQVLLGRYGLLSRDLLQSEPWAHWPALVEQLRLMEMRGHVRRGLFVEGLAGPQFALPEMVDSLRNLRSAISGSTHQPCVVVNACDPVYFSFDSQNEVLSVSRVPSNWIVFHHGQPVMVANRNGEHIRTVETLSEDVLENAVTELLSRLTSDRRGLSVTQWNGLNVLKSGGAALLLKLGFYRDYNRMTIECG